VTPTLAARRESARATTLPSRPAVSTAQITVTHHALRNWLCRGLVVYPWMFYTGPEVLSAVLTAWLAAGFNGSWLVALVAMASRVVLCRAWCCCCGSCCPGGRRSRRGGGGDGSEQHAQLFHVSLQDLKTPAVEALLTFEDPSNPAASRAAAQLAEAWRELRTINASAEYAFFGAAATSALTDLLGLPVARGGSSAVGAAAVAGAGEAAASVAVVVGRRDVDAA